ncbi:MAG TPA: metallophosphoesterase [Steroidobacteraceae bacterium]|nr:metallophosphoesterase [Steroidobacteraceae bacterium]
MFFVVATVVLTLVSAYVGLRLLPALALGHAALALAVVVLALPPLLAVGGMLGRLLTRAAWARRLTWAASLALGWVSTLVVLTLLRELALALGALLMPRPDAAALHRLSALAVPALAAVATVFGLLRALGRPRVVHVRVPLPDLAPDLQGLTIVQLSDVHVGATIRRAYVQRVVDRVNALRPDLVAITGDLVDGTVVQLAEQVAPLAQLRSRFGTFFVTGNHEYYSGAAAWIAHLRQMGMQVLMNEHVILRRGSAALLLAGVPDPTARAFDPAQRSDPRAALQGAPAHVRPRILLAHRPRCAPAAASAGFDLQLCGHTHGGQFWPWNLVVRFQEPLSIGLDRLNDLWVYTSRGTGFWGPPQRLGVPSEITCLHLVRAGSAADVARARGIEQSLTSPVAAGS